MLKKNEMIFLLLLAAMLCKEATTKKCFERQCVCNGKSISCKGKNLAVIPKFDLTPASQDAEVIDLSSNHIESLPANMVGKQRSLIKLILRNNSIEYVDQACFNVTTPGTNGISPIKHIDLQDNHLHLFPTCFGLSNSSTSLRNLQTLLIGGNLFGSRLGMNSFSGISSVKKLDLSRSLIRIIPDLIFKKLEHLEEFDLSSNNLNKMSSMIFSQHVPLLILRLNHNLLTNVPQNLPPNLKELYLSSNKLNGLTTMDGKQINILTELRILDMSRNKIYFLLYGVFSRLSQLEYLDVSFNLLKVLDVDAMAGAINLKYLFLHNNPTLIEVTHFAFLTLPKLKYVAFQQCSLSSLNLNNDTINFPIALKKIWLFGNPISCNCYIVPLVRFLKMRKVNLDPARNPVENVTDKNLEEILQRKLSKGMGQIGLTQCASPLNRHKMVVGKTLLSIPEDHLTCPDEMRFVIVASLLGIFAFFSVIPVVIFLIQVYLLGLRFVQKHFRSKKEKED